jgi:hypothetical protein
LNGPNCKLQPGQLAVTSTITGQSCVRHRRVRPDILGRKHLAETASGCGVGDIELLPDPVTVGVNLVPVRKVCLNEIGEDMLASLDLSRVSALAVSRGRAYQQREEDAEDGS